jgi:hypothetical protein
MDNEQLLTEIQKLLEGVEKRTNIRFDTVGAEMEQLRHDLRAEMQRLTARIDINTGLLEKLVPAFISYLQDAGKAEAEFRLRIAALETRVQRMERPQ